MKIALINGSPKAKGSASAILLKDLKGELNKKADMVDLSMHSQSVSEDVMEELKTSDLWIFAFPLYVDGIPGHLLSCLVQLEKAQLRPGVPVCAMVNCGFYEGIHCIHAMQIMRRWCQKAKLNWKGGIGMGAGAALPSLPPMSKGVGPRISLDWALSNLAGRINKYINQKNSGSCEAEFPRKVIYTTLNMPRFLYKLAAQSSWRKELRQNGKSERDLGKRIV